MTSSMRFGTLFLATVICSCFFAGCSPKSGNADAGKSGNAVNSEKNTDEPGKVSIELFCAKSENLGTMNSLVKKFEKENPDIKIKVKGPDNADAIQRIRQKKNNIPDILAIGGNNSYTELQNAGLLLNMSNESYISQIQNSYLQMVYDVNHNGEKDVYGIPYATNASGIIYNEDLFNKAGVSVPKTWSEFIDVINKLKSAGIQPFEFTFKDSWTCLPAWNSMATVIPDANFTADRKAGKTTFAATHKEVLEKYAELIKYGQKNVMSTGYTKGNAAFANGKAAMMINGNWAIPEIRKSNKNIKINMFAFPSTDNVDKNTVTSGVDILFAVSSKTSDEKQSAAKAFIAFMVKSENAQKYIDEQFAFSTIKGVNQKDVSVSGVKEYMANGKVSNFPDHYYPNGYDLSTILFGFIKNQSSGMNTQENIKQTLAKCDKQYDSAKVE